MNPLDELTGELDARLADADAALAARYPGDAGTRQPVHTVYVPADRFHRDLPTEWGLQAREALDRHGRPAGELADVLGLDPALVPEVHDRVLRKLASEPVEDLRIDFEDGYGARSDDEEDRTATDSARALAAAVDAGTAPPFNGIRFKSFEAPTRRRGLRTLDRFVAELAAGGLPPGFVVTLPKVTSLDQVEAMVHVCDRLELAYRLPAGGLRFELQVETPQAIVGADGTALVARMIHLAQGRCAGLHYGTYDYSASCGIAGAYQSMEHPAADHAKAVMQVAAAGTGVRLSDGSTNVLPVGDREHVRAAWRLHARLVRRSLERGFNQGWDLHPGQLPSRYLATYAFYREGLAASLSRLRAYAESSGEPGVLDEPATVTALSGFLERGVACGAIDPDEVAVTAEQRLAAFNNRPAADLRRRLLGCCDVESWAGVLVDGRPYRTEDELLARADAAARRWTAAEVDRALAAHPRIGERAGADDDASRWSLGEQSGVAGDTRTADALATANREYESRFDRVFLICATGLGAEEILASLRERMRNDADTEAGVVADELRKIALLRLRKVLDR